MLICPHCSSSGVVKNGIKSTGKQNFQCKDCTKQFQAEYQNKGADPKQRQRVVAMLLHNSGIRDIESVIGMSRRTILSILLACGGVRLIPRHRSYRSVQIDEIWSYVGTKKRKRWLLYAYAPESDEVLAFVCGSRSRATVRKLYQALKHLHITEFCTDHWKAFQGVFPSERHSIGKSFTRQIEGVNTSIRARNRRFVRKTCCFSKKIQNHDAAIAMMFAYRNGYHTF